MTTNIAVCGTMGSGKSTVVEHVAAALPDCEAIFEDDFNRTTERSLEQIDLWWRQGADLEKLDLSSLTQHLEIRFPEKRHSVSTSPSAPRQQNKRIILLETHFGRLHPALSPWIDFQVWIDTPADIAVMRKIAQLSAEMRAQHADNQTDGLRWIERFCRGYLTTTRKLFEMQRQKVRQLSELSIDGQGTALDVCTKFLQSLPEKYLPEELA